VLEKSNVGKKKKKNWNTGRIFFLGVIITYYQELKYPTISNMLDFFPQKNLTQKDRNAC